MILEATGIDASERLIIGVREKEEKGQKTGI